MFGSSRFHFLVSIGATATILVILAPVFWRPLNTSSESQVTYTFLKFVVGNDGGLGRNPLIARQIDFEGVAYDQWTNGFFLAVNGVFKLFGADTFGEQEAVVRTLAIFLFVVAGYLIIYSVSPQYPLAYYAVPLMFATNIGRDAISYVWHDLFFMALGLFAIVRGGEQKMFRYLFRAALVVLPLFLHTVLVYLFAFVVVDFLIVGNKRETLYHILWFVIGAAIVLVVLLYGSDGNIAGNFAQFMFKVKTRSVAPVLLLPEDTSLRFTAFLQFLVRRVYDAFNMGLWGMLLVAFGWTLAMRKRVWWLAALLPIWIFYAVVFRGAIFGHYYSYLPYVFFALLTLLFGAGAAISYFAFKAPHISARVPSWLPRASASPRVLVAVLLFLFAFNAYLYPPLYPLKDGVRTLFIAPPEYPPDPIEGYYEILRTLAEDNIQRSIFSLGCNSFVWKQSLQFDGSLGNSAKAILGNHVARRLRKNKPVRTCVIDAINADTINIEFLKGNS